MDLKVIIISITVSLLIIAVAMIIHWLNTAYGHVHYEIGSVNNTVNPRMIKNYYGNNEINYTAIMTEREAMARNKHVIRPCGA
ncbi:hypothetical protein JCM16161A_07750 [Vulcanisaeta sp. JCM 16161]|uniref:hypothetical protein n=1 Tax=Vulcanisaeta sp. JCM 16161 TaxID=1295372 RepID=UPI0006D11574|nr:hypothetical protein [Vulcanisaeta sp. JCM 16161]